MRVLFILFAYTILMIFIAPHDQQPQWVICSAIFVTGLFVVNEIRERK